MGTILSYPDLTLVSTLSGGSWNASLPLNNLKNQLTGKVVRSSDCTITSTVIIADTGVPNTSQTAIGYAVRCIAAIGHNITPSGTIRAKGYSDNGLTTEICDSGEQYAYSDTLTPIEMTQVPNNWIWVLPTATEARYWKIEIQDTHNPNGYIELGRLWIGEGFEPATSISYGASLGYELRDIVEESIGGVEWVEERTPKRATGMQFEVLTDAEKRKMLLMQKTIKRSGEMLYIFDGNATPENMQAESYLCKVKQASALQYPYFDNNSMPLELTEITNSPIARTLLFIVTFNMPLESDIILNKGTGTATFTRASTVNTVDDTGALTEIAVDTPAFTSGGVLIEPASTNKCTCYGVPRADSLGSELITNAADRDFSSDTGFWTKGVGITISGGQLNINTTSTLNAIGRFNVTTKGKYYTATFTIVSISSGALSFFTTEQFTVAGTYTVTGLVNISTALYLTAFGTTNAVVDNVSIKEAIDYPGTKAYHDGTVFQNPITGMTLSGSDTLGAEMLTNPSFDVNTDGWGGYKGTLASVAGGQSGNCCQLTATSGIGQQVVCSGLTFVVGTRYRITVYVKSGTSGNETGSIAARDSAYNVWGTQAFTTSAVWTLVTLEFVALTTSGSFVFQKDTTAAGTMLFDTASFKTVTYPAVLSIVNDQTAIDSAIAAEIAKPVATRDRSLLVALQKAKANGYKVYNLVTGTTAANVDITGTTTAVVSSMFGVARVLAGTATLSDSSGANSLALTGSAYASKKKENFTATATRTTRLTVAASSNIRFLAPQLEEQSVATSPMLTEGATKTRAASVLSIPTAGNIQVAPERLEFEWTPDYSTTLTIGTQTLWSSYTAANNELSINYNGVILYALKKVAGVSEYVTIPLSAVANQTYRIALKINLDGTMNLSLNDVWDLGGLGSELIVNGGFDSDLSGWTNVGTATATYNTEGSLTFTNTTASYPQFRNLNNIRNIGRVYQNSLDAKNQVAYAWLVEGSSVIIMVSGAYGSAYTNFKSIGICAVTNYVYLQLQNLSTATITVDNISSKEVYNNTTTLTPVLATTMQIGSKNSVSQTVGSIKMIKSYNRSF